MIDLAKYTPMVEDLEKRNTTLTSERSAWDGLWQDIANLIQPRKAYITIKTDSPTNDKEKQLFDSTAVQANMILANGQLSWMTPHEQPWFALEPPRALIKSDRAKKWFAECTEEMKFRFAKSNFYTEIHELYLDRGGFGTGTLYVDADSSGNLFFRNISLGKYNIAEDSRGFIDTMFFEQEMSLRALAQEFGEDSLPEDFSEKLKANADIDAKHCVVHCVYPRADADRLPGKVGGENMPLASVHYLKQKKHVLRVSGFEEMPYLTTRFLKWCDSPWGWSPSWVALPDAKQLNFIQQMMDVLAEVSAFPRMLVPTSMEGEVDTRAHGVTYFDDNQPNGTPREWLTQGRYDIGKDRVAEKQRAIERAFHVDLFQMFAQLEKQMTAREVSERASEKLTQFSPTFGRIVTELLDPLLQRSFGLLLRSGMLPPPPPEIIQPTGDGYAFIPPPNVMYSSRIALAIRSLHTVGFTRTMEHTAQIAQVRPDILDNWDLDTIARDMGRNDGVPPEWFKDEDEVVKIRQARAKTAAEKAKLESMEAAASAAGKVGATVENAPMLQAMMKRKGRAA